MRILYVEDNVNDANLVSRFMKTTHHELMVVNSLETARGASPTEFDLILVDLLLEDQRLGYVLAKELRQYGYQQPLIAITALSTPQDVLACEQAGFDLVLTKPFEITELANVIHHFEKN